MKNNKSQKKTQKKNKSQSDLYRALARKQEKHRQLLEKVEKATVRFERRRARLSGLEADIADLEQQLSAPRARRRGKQSSGDGKLQSARLIFNPTSGRGDEDNAARLAKIVSSLRAHGIEAKVGLKTSGSAARQLTQKAMKNGDELVIVAGGDGTIQDVAGELAGSSTVLGIIPTGTMNNVARSLGIPLEIEYACALIGMGTTRHIDLGRVISNGDSKNAYFVDCAGVGLSAIAAEGGQAFAKRHWRIVPEAVRKFFETKPGPMRLELDDKVIEASTQMVIVSNAPLVGTQMLAMPDAKMDDGLLDVQIYEGMSDAALMKFFKAASSGTPEPIDTFRVRHVRITADEPLPTNSDAGIVPEQRVVEMEVVPAALSVIVGNGIALTVPVEAAPGAPTLAEDPPVTTAKSVNRSKESEADNT